MKLERVLDDMYRATLELADVLKKINIDQDDQIQEKEIQEVIYYLTKLDDLVSEINNDNFIKDGNDNE
jgi:hypothetical protein